MAGLFVVARRPVFFMAMLKTELTIYYFIFIIHCNFNRHTSYFGYRFSSCGSQLLPWLVEVKNSKDDFKTVA